jgi:integrase
LTTHRDIFSQQIKRIPNKLQNPRLLKITFHNLRHWKATMEYHKTKDILHVKRLLGHKSIKSIMRYTQLVDFVVKVAWALEESCKLLEEGFQYVCDYDQQISSKK